MAFLKTAFCYFFAAFFFIAGILHIVHDDVFAAIVPPLLPFPYSIVWITGVLELVLAIGLVLRKYRKLSGLLLAPYLIAVLPANIYMAMADIPFNGRDLTDFQLWFRVVLQFPLIALILWASGNISKPG